MSDKISILVPPVFQIVFRLGPDRPVAYFSSDFGVNCCETIEQCSSNEALSWEELSRYLGGKGNPTPGWCGYPLSYHLVDDSLQSLIFHNTMGRYFRGFKKGSAETKQKFCGERSKVERKRRGKILSWWPLRHKREDMMASFTHQCEHQSMSGCQIGIYVMFNTHRECWKGCRPRVGF